MSKCISNKAEHSVNLWFIPDDRELDKLCVLVEEGIENKDKWERISSYALKLRHSQLAHTKHSWLHTSMLSEVILATL